MYTLRNASCALLFFGSVAFFLCVMSFALYFAARLGALFTEGDLVEYLQLVGILGVGFGVFSFGIFLPKCPSCKQAIFLPPWRRDRGKRISPKVLWGIIQCRSFICGSCDETISC
jgi:hypothetical protein